MRSKSVTLTTDGAGAAVLDVGLPTSKLHAIQIANTALTGGTVGITNAGRSILTAAAGNVNAMLNVRSGAVTPAGAAITDSNVNPVLHGPATVTVAGGGAAKAVTIVFFYE